MKILVSLTTETETLMESIHHTFFIEFPFCVFMYSHGYIKKWFSRSVATHESIITRYNVPALALMLVRQSIILVNTAFTWINDTEKLGVTL
jgi:hypothetical protein